MKRAQAKVFISYSRVDLAFADALAEALRARGFDALLDRTEIAAGELWRDRLANLIAASDTVVFAISPKSVASPVCGWELERSAALGKRVLPIVCRPVPQDAVPEMLARLNWIIAGPDLPPAAVDQLEAALRTDLEWVREHTRLTEIALHWEQQRRSSTGLLRGVDLENAEHWLTRRPDESGAPVDLHRAFIAASRAASRFRSRAWAVGATVIATVSLLLAGFAEVSRRDAVTQRDAAERARVEAQTQEARATRALGTAVEAADTFSRRIALQLQDEIGMPAPLVKRILEPALALQDKLTASGETGASLRMSQIDSINLMAMTRLRIGETEGACHDAARAVELARALVAAEPNSAAATRRLVLSLGTLSRAEAQAGHADIAESAGRERLTLARQAAAATPSDTAARELFIALTGLDGLLEKQRRFAEARPLLEEALPLARAQWARTPSADAADELETVLQNLGLLNARTNRFADALPLYEQALQMMDGDGRPVDAETVRSRAGLDQNIATAAFFLGNKKRALAATDDSVAAIRVLAADRRNRDTQALLATILFTTGGMRFAMSQSADEGSEAAKSMLEAVQIERELAADPADVPASVSLAGKLLTLAQAHLAKPDAIPASQAVAFAAEALSVLQRLDAEGRLPDTDRGELKQAKALAARLKPALSP